MPCIEKESRSGGGFVFGLDTDTIEGLQETARLAAEAKLEFAQFSRLTPLPGTAQWKRFQAEDRLVERDWSKYNFQNVVYRPKRMNADELNQAVRDAWFEFYSLRQTTRRLLRNRPPIERGNLILWALNLGISRIMQNYSRTQGNQVRAHEQAQSVFEMRPAA
jgi:radical SAM superfamily enzyme YgiQ (UPF0313 family)